MQGGGGAIFFSLAHAVYVGGQNSAETPPMSIAHSLLSLSCCTTMRENARARLGTSSLRWLQKRKELLERRKVCNCRVVCLQVPMCTLYLWVACALHVIFVTHLVCVCVCVFRSMLDGIAYLQLWNFVLYLCRPRCISGGACLHIAVGCVFVNNAFTCPLRASISTML